MNTIDMTRNVNDEVTATAIATIDISHTLLSVVAVEPDTDAAMI